MIPVELDTIEEIYCSFCKKKSREAKVMIRSPIDSSKVICNICVKLITRTFEEPK